MITTGIYAIRKLAGAVRGGALAEQGAKATGKECSVCASVRCGERRVRVAVWLAVVGGWVACLDEKKWKPTPMRDGRG